MSIDRQADKERDKNLPKFVSDDDDVLLSESVDGCEAKTNFVSLLQTKFDA